PYDGGASVARTLWSRQGADGTPGGGGGAAMTTRTQAAPKPTLATTITTEVAKRVVGQEVMVERLLIGLLTGGHILLEGVPGLAKTLAVKTVAECGQDRKSTRLNSSHVEISYAVFCLKKKNKETATEEARTR